MKIGSLMIDIVIIALLATVAGSLAGCGGGEKAAPTLAPRPALSPTPPPIHKTALPTPTAPPPPREVEVPVSLKGAKNVGSLQIELVYDPAVLEATGVKAGELAKNAMMEFNLKTPGRVMLGIIDALGMNGDGALATLSFKVLGKEVDTPISVEKIEAYTTTLVDIRVKSSGGNFAAKDRSFTAPVINLTP